MIPIPANIKAVLLVIIVGGIATLQAMAPLEPTWKWIGGVVQLLALIEGLITAVSSKKPPSPPPPAALAVMLLAVSLATTSCVKNGQVVPPPQPIPQDIEAVAACVVPLLVEGAKFDDLVAKCAPQDASLIVAVLELLVKSDRLAEDRPEVSVQASICYQQARKEGLVQ